MLREGSDVTIEAYGIMINEALKAAEILAEKGISAEVVKLKRLERAEYPVLSASAAKTGRLVITEESAERGSLGVRVLSDILRRGDGLKNSATLNLGSGIVEHGSVSQLRAKY